MFKLLIIDDEKQVRETLRQFIDWESLGVGAVETARNGLVALELIDTFVPDIVLCDLKMPKMDGITFAGHLRERLSECRIIFVSGYSDKENLKSAIKLQAIRFVEKPIDMVELESAVKQAVLELQQINARKAQLRRQAALIQENVPFTLERVALGLIRKEADYSKESRVLSRIGFHFMESSQYIAVAVHIVWDGLMLQEEQTATRQEMIQHFNISSSTGALKKNSPGNAVKLLSGFCSDNLMAVLYSDITGRDIKRIVNGLLIEIESIRSGRLSAIAGISTEVNSIESIPMQFYRAKEALHHLFYTKEDCICSADEIEMGMSFIPDPLLINTFKEYISQGYYTGIEQLVTKIVDLAVECHDQDINHVKNCLFNLIVIARESPIKGHPETTDKQMNQSYIWSEFGNSTRIYELKDYVLNYVRLSLQQEDSIGLKIKGIQEYVHNQYQRSDLSLRDISESCNLSQSYLCSFFKKTIGKTLVEYITELRVEKAIDLLKDEQIKLYQIAELTGFCDANYFSTIFKKVTGFTPSVYRERLHE